MTWLSRTLPVSAVVHMAAAVPLFLFPVFSGDMLPEPRREPLTVLAAPPSRKAQSDHRRFRSCPAAGGAGGLRHRRRPRA